VRHRGWTSGGPRLGHEGIDGGGLSVHGQREIGRAVIADRAPGIVPGGHGHCDGLNGDLLAHDLRRRREWREKSDQSKRAEEETRTARSRGKLQVGVASASLLREDCFATGRPA
jgi:hypothetical protein